MTNAIARLNEFGQSPWYDNLTRTLVEKGGLNRLIEDDGIRGVTSNPTIFEKAMASGDAYDEQLATLAAQGLSTEDIYWELVCQDVGGAADILRSTYDRLQRADGYVSVEVSPERAHDTAATIEQAKWLAEKLDRANIMIKIPATDAGLPAITEVIASGINVNVTLIFGLDVYERVIDAYWQGLHELLERKGDPTQVHSVASFFVSRVDTEADRLLPTESPAVGRVAVANAKLAYERFRRKFAGAQWALLRAQGATVQRPLWASTSTKNPAYSDTLYVDELVGPDTVNTLAQASIDALRDHGDPQPETVSHDLGAAHQTMVDLADAGVSYDEIIKTLEHEGVASFVQSYRGCLTTLDNRRTELVG